MKRLIITAVVGAIVGYFVLKMLKGTFEARKNNLGEVLDSE